MPLCVTSHTFFHPPKENAKFKVCQKKLQTQDRRSPGILAVWHDIFFNPPKRRMQSSRSAKKLRVGAWYSGCVTTIISQSPGSFCPTCQLRYIGEPRGKPFLLLFSYSAAAAAAAAAAVWLMNAQQFLCPSWSFLALHSDLPWATFEFDNSSQIATFDKDNDRGHVHDCDIDCRRHRNQSMPLNDPQRPNTSSFALLQCFLEVWGAEMAQDMRAFVGLEFWQRWDHNLVGFFLPPNQKSKFYKNFWDLKFWEMWD